MPHAPLRGVFFQEQAQALNKASMQVGVVYPDFRSLRTLSLSSVLDTRYQTTIRDDVGVSTVRLHGWNVVSAKLRGFLFRIKTSQLIDTYVEKFGIPDLLHAHGVLWGGVSAREISSKLDIPFVTTAHSTDFSRGRIESWQVQFVEETLQNANSVIAVGPALADELVSYAEGRDILVVPNVVDTDLFTLPPKSRSLVPFRFLLIAQLRPKKGVDILLRAFARAFSGQKNIRLEIGGDGGQKNELEQLAASLGIAEQVQFLGSLSRTEVRNAMWRANTFVLSSYVETFGVVVIEAMATGLPVVATRSGGPEEIISSDTGWLTDTGDVEGLAEALVDAYSRWNEMNARAPEIRNEAVAKYGEKAVVEQLRGIYESVLEDA